VRNLGGMPETIQESGGGVIYDTEQELIEAMDRLLQDPLYRQKLGLNGYNAYRKKWTPEAHLKRYFELIEETAAIRARFSVLEGGNLDPSRAEFPRRLLVTD
jgi:glycosyltransferase involved in cell wall biosynthesis